MTSAFPLTGLFTSIETEKETPVPGLFQPNKASRDWLMKRIYCSLQGENDLQQL
jgi:hypothetical protein